MSLSALYTSERRGVTHRAMKALLWSLPLLALLVGCQDTSPKEVACGDYETFDLSSCDPASLKQLQRDGIWNMDIEWLGGSYSPGVFILKPNGEQLNGTTAQAKKVDEGNVYLAAMTQRSGRTYRLAMAGCTADDPTHFGGQVRLCIDQSSSTVGAFRAARITRRDGEDESAGLSLVSETQVNVGTPADVFVAGGYAYVSAFTGGLTIFDVHDPAHPQQVAQFAGLNDYWNDAWVKDGVLYVASANEGLVLYDVSDPQNPIRLGSTPADKPNVHTVFIDGTRLYATAPFPNAQVLIYNIENPKAPVLLSRFVANGADPSANKWPHDVFAAGNRLYVNHWALGYVVVDVTDPTHPKQLGAFQWPLDTSHASAVGVFNGKTIAFEGGEDWDAHLRVYDVTDPTHISQIAEVKSRSEVSIHNMVLVGTKLYVAYYQDGLRVFDVSDPTHPTQTAYYNTWRESDPARGASFYEGAIGIRVPGDGYIYSAETSRGLMIFREN